MRKTVKTRIKEAKRHHNLQVLEKMTDLIDDRHRIVEHPPLIVRVSHTAAGRPTVEALGMFLHAYLESLSHDRRQLLSRYRVIDVARKAVGVGSVGTLCWVVLLMGADNRDPLFLQVKEARPSVLFPYFDVRLPYSEGCRVVVGQHLIQGSPDIFLGWGELDRTQFHVRQLRDWKGGAELQPGETELSNFVEYCGFCGWALALAHAKSGDAAMIAGYVGKSDQLDAAFGKFGLLYADQTDRDHEAMARAARKGQIAVAPEAG